MNRRSLNRCLAVLAVSAAGLLTLPSHANEEAPDALIKRVSNEVLDQIKTDKSLQSGDVARIAVLVDTKVLPHVNFQRMTASAVGPAWRQANPQQKQRLQEAFKTLLVRTYAGALTQVSDQSIAMKPLRAAATDKEVVVRSEIVGRGDPIQLDYRLEKTPGQGAGWKIYNFNVLGVWLVETYRSQFSQEINANGIDGLITTLEARNQSNGKKS